jgi:hypothetical protein
MADAEKSMGQLEFARYPTTSLGAVKEDRNAIIF